VVYWPSSYIVESGLRIEIIVLNRDTLKIFLSSKTAYNPVRKGVGRYINIQHLAVGQTFLFKEGQ
jgi:hypothetical protein